ncbi:hypothetical protein DQ04_00761170 [Trypanosoma grayi]|uniref:hypothetical protein n=1 Tax=Trypanosoma grayi TaxID=71804 RepID=UPI0004F442AB|nr:hypothetical protein DQ04_00761170 [Trypanosoma grayi]KEG13837.1 hypothetical protein DQ04_00761170 [Trypanosoma grayi]
MRIVQATHAYANTGRHYLSLCKDDLILVLEEHRSGWWIGQNVRGAKGVVPSTYLRDFVLDAPSIELLHEVSVMQIAQQFEVDLSTHVPTPLVRGDALSCGGSKCNGLNRTDLEEGVERFLVQRETARRRLSECLNDFEREKNYAAKDEVTSDDNVMALKVGISRRQIDALNAHEEQIRDELHSLRDMIAEKKCEVPPRLLRLVDEALGEKDVCSDQVALYREALHEQLHQCHRDVRKAEGELSAFSEGVQKADRSCREGRELLSYRISLRDAKVRALLNYWSERAEVAKDSYLQEKVRTHHKEALKREEEQRLRHMIAEGREKYIKSEDDLLHLQERVQEIKSMLDQKVELERLSEAIRRAAQEENTWKEKVAGTKRNV